MIVDIQKYKGCCKDESKTFKSSEQQKTLDIDLFTCIKTLVAEPLFYLSNVKNIVSVQASKQLFLAHAPPERLEHCPHFIFFRNIRIWFLFFAIIDLHGIAMYFSLLCFLQSKSLISNKIY